MARIEEKIFFQIYDFIFVDENDAVQMNILIYSIGVGVESIFQSFKFAEDEDETL